MKRLRGENGKGSLGRDLAIGIAAGLAANVVVEQVDKLLSRLVSEEHERREKSIREGSPHDVAGKVFATKALGHEPSRRMERIAQAAFTVGYGTLWGVLFALTRRAAPGSSRLLGLPFAVPFFLACDGVIAPKLGLTPGLGKIPWQPSAKELTNHIAWTATAELVHRLGRGLGEFERGRAA